MPKLVFSPQAKDDLSEIAAYIAQDKPIAARNFVRQLRGACQRLKAQPWAGEQCPEFSSRSYRKIVFRNYVIIYEVGGAALQIVRVVHAARDWGKLVD